MLVIPVIPLQHGLSMHPSHCDIQEKSHYFSNPVDLSCLLRLQNAKIIHFINVDDSDCKQNLESIDKISKKLDIPFQVESTISTVTDFKAWIDAGAYRVIITSEINFELLQALIAIYSSSKIVVKLNKDIKKANKTITKAKEIGINRFLFDGTIPDCITLVNSISGVRITAGDMVFNRADLKQLETVKGAILDSLLLGEAFYQNAFPCQKFWCWNTVNQLDLDNFSTAPLKSPN